MGYFSISKDFILSSREIDAMIDLKTLDGIIKSLKLREKVDTDSNQWQDDL